MQQRGQNHHDFHSFAASNGWFSASESLRAGVMCKGIFHYKLTLMDLSVLTQEDKRSWHLNAAALDRACRNWPKAAKIIERNLQLMTRKELVAPAYISRCHALLAAGPEQMKEAFLALTDEGQTLRSIHPFAGLLTPSERQDILDRTRRVYR